MEEHKAVIGALFFILMMVGANFIMYGIVRGATRSKGKGFWETFGNAMNASTKKKTDEMQELRKKMEELQKDRKEE